MVRMFALRVLPLLVLSSSLLPLWAAAPKPYDPQQNPPRAETYRRLAAEVEQHLKQGVLDKWFPRCVDKEHGGFRPNFREDWSPGKNNDKFLVFQARQTWVAAEVAKRYPELREQYLGYARHGVDFLDRTMWDAERGGMFWGLDPTGKIGPRFGTEKHVYGIAFGIYAAANAYEATKDKGALELAQRTFRWLDEHAHDASHGGYFEALSREGRPILKPPAPDKARDLLGTAYGYKSMNGHIHLLEAITALYRVWPERQVEERLRELLEVVGRKIAVEPGCLNQFFTPDWRPVPEHDSFGHDVETAYLLVEAAEALGRHSCGAGVPRAKENAGVPSAPRNAGETPAPQGAPAAVSADEDVWRVARSLVDHALQCGWDQQRGGFYDRGVAFGPACGLEKIWWTQAEGLNALLLMHARYGRETPRYWNAFLRQWEFIVHYQIDQKHGEWYEQVSHDGKPRPGQDKGTIWKAAYHNGRALMNVAERLRELGDARGPQNTGGPDSKKNFGRLAVSEPLRQEVARGVLATAKARQDK